MAKGSCWATERRTGILARRELKPLEMPAKIPAFFPSSKNVEEIGRVTHELEGFFNQSNGGEREREREKDREDFGILNCSLCFFPLTCHDGCCSSSSSSSSLKALALGGLVVPKRSSMKEGQIEGGGEKIK